MIAFWIFVQFLIVAVEEIKSKKTGSNISQVRGYLTKVSCV